MSAQQVIINECPICMDNIEGVCNRVVTECGHNFHCSCLMQNVSHNGFGCPYCRAKMADEPEEDDDDEDDDEDDDDNTVFDDEALTSFRLFHQRINGEEIVDEEDTEDWESVAEEEEEVTAETEPIPDSVYITQKLTERGITFEDLVKNILYQDHHDSDTKYNEHERRAAEIFGQFRAVITQYRPNNIVATTNQPVVPVQVPLEPPVIAEA